MEAGEAQGPDIRIVVGVLVGDPISGRGLGHGVEEPDLGRLMHVVAPALAETGGRGEHDCSEHVAGVLHVERLQHGPKVWTPVAGHTGLERGLRQGCAQEHDPEVGVATHGSAGRLDARQHPPA